MRVWRYQRGNQNPWIEEEQTIQWTKEKVQKDTQRSTKHTHRTKDLVTRNPLRSGGELMCSGRVSSTCSTSDIRRVNLFTNPVISHEWGQDRNCLIFDIDTCAIASPSCQGFMWKLFFIFGRILRHFCSLHNIFYVDGQLLRRSVPNYADGVYHPSGADRPNPFLLSKAAHHGEAGLGSKRARNAMLVYFGKLLQTFIRIRFNLILNI